MDGGPPELSARPDNGVIGGSNPRTYIRTMHIPPTNFQLPMHIAQAYGMRASSAVPQNRAAGKESAGATGQLVAGSVSEPVNFEATPTAHDAAAIPAPVFQMYTRAADRIEAATAIQIGRSIDVTG